MSTPSHTRLRRLTRVVLGLLVLIPAATVLYKITVLDYRLANILPLTEYRVSRNMTLDSGDGRVRVATYTPADDVRQTIRDEIQSAPQALHHAIEADGHNRRAVWLGAPVPDDVAIRYEFSTQLSPVRFTIADDLEVPDGYPASVPGGTSVASSSHAFGRKCAVNHARASRIRSSRRISYRRRMRFASS